MIKTKNAKRITQNAGKIRRYTLHATRFATRGFTLVEVLVTISIFMVITGIILTRYKDFSGGIVLSNLAYEIAITIRQAQVYGVAVKNASGFNYPYGVHFSNTFGNSFVLFADVDLPSNGYDDTSEIIETLTTRQGNTIDNFCAVTVSDITKCSTDITSPLSSLDITFLRPDPDAKFRTYIGAVTDTNYKEATITVKSPKTEKIKIIKVRSTGQISVE